jgi:isocitrate dehydrogenase
MKRVDAFQEFLVGIKGPLTTPIGGAFARSTWRCVRRWICTYVCARCCYFEGVPSPVKRPQDVDMVIFRENTEDIYTGIEFELGSEDNQRFRDLLKQNFPKEYAKIRFPDSSGIGMKPVSQEGTQRLVRAAIQWSLDQQTQVGHPGAQGQYHEIHRRRVPQLGLRSGRK